MHLENRAAMVTFWKQYETTDRETGAPTKIPLLRYYNVFNVAQCDGVEAPDAAPFEPLAFRPLEAAESIVKGYANPPAIAHDGGSCAYYRPSSDSVHMPERERMASVEAYYATLFHELAHSTGHVSRLNRGLGERVAAFGSADYGREELVAEMAAAFLCGHAGIEPATIENQASYVASWLKTLKADKRLAVTSAGAAQRAADCVLGL